MQFTIDEDMTITEIAGGLILVAHISWTAALLVMLLLAAIFDEIIPGCLTTQTSRQGQ
jgi:hypothetical protein